MKKSIKVVFAALIVSVATVFVSCGSKVDKAYNAAVSLNKELKKSSPDSSKISELTKKYTALTSELDDDELEKLGEKLEKQGLDDLDF